MNKQIKELAIKAGLIAPYGSDLEGLRDFDYRKFAELIVKELCGLMEQAEDDAYHCFEPAERPTEYIAWLVDWRTRFEKHFGVEE